MDSNAVLRLTEIDGGGNSTELFAVTVSEADLTLGRSSAADIRFGEEDQSVSRRQFEVSFRDGVPTLKNIGRNPVLYNNGRKQLAPGAQINIVPGLEVGFRESKLRFDVEVPEIYCLKTRGAGGRTTFELESNRKYTVGRSPECDITLDSSGVSRRHCRVQVAPGGILKVHDLGSVNGIRLFVKGEVGSENSDIEVPCGVKFIIGDIKCVFDKKGRDSGKRKRIALSVALLLLLVAFLSVFVLKDGQSTRPAQSGKPAAGLPSTTANDVPNKPSPEQSTKKADLVRERNIDRIVSIIRDDASFEKKADRFAGLAEDPALKSLAPLCGQLAGYYSQCSAVGKMRDSLSEEFKQQRKEARGSIERMEFDFGATPSVEKLEDEVDRLKALHKAIAGQMRQKGIEAPESPDELVAAAAHLAEMVDEYGENIRSLSFVWTDLRNSSFASSKFDKKEMTASIDALYPGEGMGSELCAKIGAIINYQERMSAAYQGLVGQVGTLLTNYTGNGVSASLLPERTAMKPLRDAIGSPLPEYFGEPPAITGVSSNLYNHLEAISKEWTNLEFLTFCGQWKSGLEQKQRVFAQINKVVPLVDRLCAEASLKCAEDLDKGLEPYREIKGRLAVGEELGFNDAHKLVRVYNLCDPYLRNDLFCKLRKESKKQMVAVRADCLSRLLGRLKKECDDGAMAMDASEKDVCVGNAEKILEILDGAIGLPQDFETRIKDYRMWVEDSIIERREVGKKDY